MLKYLVFLFTILCHLSVFSQGKLMLVGGGSEDYDSWSDTPYQWAIDQSVNKKVAVISYSDQSEWIPDYFMSLGAEEAKNIKIDSREVADMQSTYDELMTYDIFFFKGGDQSNYYKFYKNTKTSQAVIDKFNEGGVISGTSAGMAILSGVIFTAEEGSVYPDEALADFKSSDITLADDLFPFLPGFIVDSHFTERGRIGRLLPFMAYWYDQTGILLTGIGVDDRTALCIDEDEIGSVYGTGSVSIYNASSFSSYHDASPVSDSIHAIQLLHNHIIDLKNLEILNGPKNNLPPSPQEESGNYEVLLSGSDGLSSNNSFMNHFINEMGSPNDTIIVIYSPGGASDYTDKFEEMEVPFIMVETTSANNSEEKIDLRNKIRRAKKVLFVENTDNQLFEFLNDGPTGTLINEHIRRNHMITGFIGSDSRYAGKAYVKNYLNDQYDAYYGDLTYDKGLGLLQTSVIMPNTYDQYDADYYENTTAAITYAMVADSTKYGIYLNRNSYLHFDQDNGKNHFTCRGQLSALVITNPGTTAALATEPVNSSGDTRNYVGFTDMTYHLLNDNSMVVGTPAPTQDEPYEFEAIVTSTGELINMDMKIYPNPIINGDFTIEMSQPDPGFEIVINDLMGNEVMKGGVSEKVTLIGAHSFPAGAYIINIVKPTGEVIRKKLIKN